MKRNGSVFFQHPIGLWEAEPYKTVVMELGHEAKFMYWDVVEQIRMGNGIDSLDHVLTLYDDVRHVRRRESYQKKLRELLLPKYNLFYVNQQRMVSIVDHASAVRARNRAALDGPSMFEGMEGWE